jgi:hypothetical protein
LFFNISVVETIHHYSIKIETARKFTRKTQQKEKKINKKYCKNQHKVVKIDYIGSFLITAFSISSLKRWNFNQFSDIFLRKERLFWKKKNGG